ncbi:hypothetical protein ANO11243_018020 [Dothideomycetidae sp. 11243]|nr:hypothetical protein ANO11243_018020 [fungal sp. No.11243]
MVQAANCDRCYRRKGSPGDGRADAVSEVSFLSRNAAGERQSYLGTASGVLLADLVRCGLDATVTRPASPALTETLLINIDEGGNDGVATANEDKTRNARPSSRRQAHDLPSKEAANELVQAYLNHDAIIYPFLSPAAIALTVRRFYHEPGYYAARATPFEVFSVNMVFAIATSHVRNSQWQKESSAVSHNTRAMRELDRVLAQGPVEQLQAVLLMCQYRSSSPIRDNSASMWHLVGVAARLCIELGLHREAGYPLDPAVAGRAAFEEQEVRRRCFWTLVSMDRIVSILLGRPFAIRDEDIDTALPREEVASPGVQQQQVGNVTTTRLAVFNKIVEYRLLCGDISSCLHGKRARRTAHEGDGVWPLMQTLARQLHEWHESVPLLRVPHQDQRELSCYLSPEWYDLLAANASLMLWRPSPLLAEQSHNRQMFQRILESATAAVMLYADLHRSRKLNYNWITLQSVFLGGLSYIYAVSQHFRHRRATGQPLLAEEPSPMDVVRTTKACSRVLVAVGERWHLPRHCHEVFDRLGDAVLADTMQAGGREQQQQQHQQNHHQQQQHQHTPSATAIDLQIQAQTHSAVHPLGVASLAEQTFLAEGGVFQFSPLAVDNEFLNCFDDLQQLCDDQYLDDSVMHMSQDWRDYLDLNCGP